MDQVRGIEQTRAVFPEHLLMGKMPQLLVDCGPKLVCCTRLAVFGLVQHPRTLPRRALVPCHLTNLALRPIADSRSPW